MAWFFSNGPPLDNILNTPLYTGVEGSISNDGTTFISQYDTSTCNSFGSPTNSEIHLNGSGLKKFNKTNRDPKSHRIIEKRRRDRMNNSLADLSRLIPAAYLKQGQSRVEKTEIIELAIKHILNLSSQLKSTGLDGDDNGVKINNNFQLSFSKNLNSCCHGRSFLGFREASNEALNFLIDKEGFSVSDPLCAKLREHLHEHGSHFLPDSETSDLDCGDQPLTKMARVSVPASQDSPPAYRGLKHDLKLRFKAEVESSGSSISSTESPVQESPSKDQSMTPGFILHTTGSYYLPCVVPGALLETPNSVETVHPVLHPISIPVDFQNRTVVSIQHKQ